VQPFLSAHGVAQRRNLSGGQGMDMIAPSSLAHAAVRDPAQEPGPKGRPVCLGSALFERRYSRARLALSSRKSLSVPKTSSTGLGGDSGTR
jgi:hypothetical protein